MKIRVLIHRIKERNEKKQNKIKSENTFKMFAKKGL